ncbi:hypothetical protein KC331_g9886 [Hortaea werneckii]|uniref:RRM domain-containing protein n=1 Tax=Hortaea werneckii TaxID=91943 RepID=A0A3M7CVD0_HORWE|nr:hypothetical protein KC331_g9886 [Hortaea werneckii]KAI7702640.1 hypothetical protein KC353_g14613 [Hortaea werneckii]RMY56041.1 hypothetical protein D0865_03860 [Hortaea werneckii]
MACPEKVTVDKAYFDALLRRANLHTSAQPLARPDPTNVTVARTEYESLLRVSKEYELLKSALFQGGITAETLDILISGAGSGGTRKDSGASGLKAGPNGFEGQLPAYQSNLNYQNQSSFYQDVHWRRDGSIPSSTFRDGNSQQTQAGATLQVPSFSRQASYGAPASSIPDDSAFVEDDDDDDDDNLIEEGRPSTLQPPGLSLINERRTLYFSGFSDRTTYKDFVSVIKGGQIVSINLRPERSGTVTFLEGAEAFLAWVRRHDIYLHSKRIEVKWADRQYRLNNHIHHKILHGATRNLIIRNARSHGLTAAQIRADLDHIHSLVIIDISFRPPPSLCPSSNSAATATAAAGIVRGDDDAYVETNAVHNALFARTCMMSRTGYKGCRIEFFPDQCATPLPVPAVFSRSRDSRVGELDPQSQSQRKMMNKGRNARGVVSAGTAMGGGMGNRFELLKVGDGDDDEEEEEEEEGSDEEDGISMGARPRPRPRRLPLATSEEYEGYDDEEPSLGYGVRLSPCDSGTED